MEEIFIRNMESTDLKIVDSLDKLRRLLANVIAHCIEMEAVENGRLQNCNYIVGPYSM